ncbi:B12-binding domain-containing radical SAM protein [Patescibacteria group bacterium]
MKKILLLNPPGDKIYIRDYYRSKISKSRYYYHPLDLLYLSGRFSANNFKIYLIDAIADNQSEMETLSAIRDINPDIILSLISSPSYNQDFNFLKSVKSLLVDCRLILTGDVCRDMYDKIMCNNNFIDAILLDFSTDDIIKYLNNDKSKIISNIIYRNGNKIIFGKEVHDQSIFNVPLPRWDLFHLEKYSFPFSKKKRVASILTDFGCPYQCSFCSINTLGFKLRPINSVIEEIELLKKNNMDEFFIRDQSFGAKFDRTIELCQKIIDGKFNIGWTCFSRVDIIKEDLIKIMKKAGVHTIIFGIESSNNDILKKYGKNISNDQIRKVIRLCRENKVRVVGTFIIGLPGESKESILKTIKFAKELKLDYASFNIAAPTFSSKLRTEAIAKNWVDKDNIEMDTSKSVPLWKNQELSNEEIYKLHRYAITSFYSDPRYLIRRLLAIRNFGEIIRSIQEAKFLFFD